MEVGHSTCAAVFDDDPEVVGGRSSFGLGFRVVGFRGLGFRVVWFRV